MTEQVKSTSWKVRVPDRDYWREQIKCQFACPVNTDSRGYVRAIAEGDEELAYLIARGPNPLASICGRVCGAPCESECRRAEIDKPVSIRALKRYVCERFGPEARADGGSSLPEFLREAALRHPSSPCRDQNELLPLLQALTRGEIPKVCKKNVGIIGSGPAGLAAAHDLALLGFSVTIYEMESVLAGMLAVGVPEYRLPRDLIRAEVEVIQAMGVEAQLNCEIGKDIDFPTLRERHDAVIVAVGAKCSRALPVPGADAEGVIGGVEFLRDVSLDHAPDLGRRVVVIGGGNVAYDVGRTVLRQISLDAARSAARAEGVAEVHLCSLESLDEMPADDIEIIEGDEEGIHRCNSLAPTEILCEETPDGKRQVAGVRFQKCLSVFDSERRFNPTFDKDAITDIACDHVLISIGQDYDLSFIDAERDGLTMTERGLVACDPGTGQTNASDVYIAGDLAYGPKLLIHAVASGKAVARAIYERVTGTPITSEQTEIHFPLPAYSRESGYEKTPRAHPATAEPCTRITSQANPVEFDFTPSQAHCEAARCFDCGVNTIFDGEICILCGGCVDVCPEICLRIVSADALLDGSPTGQMVADRLEDRPAAEGSAILKDETKCIRCGLCAERCPVGAITMERFHFQELPHV